jgi:predicted unusual protein kinase regulating ubiquinone biosynthesis (AarF/ABC1/UbiB family)
VFLDHGLYRQLDPVLRLHYASLFNSIVKLDLLNVKYYTTKFITEGSGKEIDIDTIDNKMLASMITSRAWNDKVNQYGLPEVMTEQESIFLKSYVSENYEKMVSCSPHRILTNR